MTTAAGHVRNPVTARKALAETVQLCRDIERESLRRNDTGEIVASIRAGHLALASAAYLKALVELLEKGGGSRGSYLVTNGDGIEIHPDIKDPATSKPLRFKPENTDLRESILQIGYDPDAPDLFACRQITPRRAELPSEAFEVGWKRFREGRIYDRR